MRNWSRWLQKGDGLKEESADNVHSLGFFATIFDSVQFVLQIKLLLSTVNIAVI